MKKFEISKNRRVKITPYTSRLENYGVGGYTVYNHMLLPTHFKSLEDEYLIEYNFARFIKITNNRITGY